MVLYLTSSVGWQQRSVCEHSPCFKNRRTHIRLHTQEMPECTAAGQGGTATESAVVVSDGISCAVTLRNYQRVRSPSEAINWFCWR